MNMQWFDWGIVAGLLGLVTWLAIYTKRYVRTVADFLAANRCAGRYLITIAKGAVAASAIGMVAYFEMFYQAGFTGVWWQFMVIPISIGIALSGWIIYRFRQSRAMTMAQFFEMRYSRKFRIFMGMLAFTAGIMTFGIYPAIGARFFIYFCGLPTSVSIGVLSVPTYPLVMIFLLGISVFFTLTGGQISVMLTDFCEGLFTNVMSLVIIITVFLLFGWSRMTDVLLVAPPEASMVHPLNTSETPSFNAWYFVMWVIIEFYNHKTWQDHQGYDCAAITPHEAKMGVILGLWRRLVFWLMVLVLVIGAYTFMHHPDFATQAEVARNIISQIDNDQLQKQVTVPVAAGQFLPPGIMGAMCALALAAFVSTHNTYMHSWGSIFIQDVVMPFRKKPFAPGQHLKLLRYSIVGVAVFVFFFSLIFKQTEYILMYLQLVGALFIAGAGSVMIGGFYWKRGTTQAAWAAMLTGSVLALVGLVVRQIDPDFFLNGMHIAFIASGIACTVYLLVSLLGKRTIFNMDQLLHHGKYATQDTQRLHSSSVSRFWRLLGITEEFTLGDKVIYLATFIWSVGWFTVFVVGTIYSAIFEVSLESWLYFWRIYIWIIFSVSVFTLVWLGTGGILNVRSLFRRLEAIRKNDADDGWVTEDHVSAGETRIGSTDAEKDDPADK